MEKRNYQNGKIYCIRNYVDNDIYIGSSCQPLSKRMAWHRKTSYQTKMKNRPIYKKINELGIDQFYIELIEECQCENVEQLRRREGEFIREMKPTLNKDIAGRTPKEWSKENFEKRQIINRRYRENNDAKIKQRKKEDYEKKKQQINEKARQKYKDNNEVIECCCGSTILKTSLRQHCKSKHHQNYLNNNIENNVQIPKEECQDGSKSSSSQVATEL